MIQLDYGVVVIRDWILIGEEEGARAATSIYIPHMKGIDTFAEWDYVDIGHTPRMVVSIDGRNVCYIEGTDDGAKRRASEFVDALMGAVSTVQSEG